MTLDELIKALEVVSQDRVLRRGFKNPHSYRGYYDQLAFEPAENVLVADMLADARSARGRTFTGYKGGEFRMSGWTDVWLSEYGNTGEALAPAHLGLWLMESERTDPVRDTGGNLGMTLCDNARKAGLAECLPDPSGKACAEARAEQAESRIQDTLRLIRNYRQLHPHDELQPEVDVFLNQSEIKLLLEKLDA